MSEPWKPRCRARIEDGRMVVVMELKGVLPATLLMTFEEGQLRVRGQHEEFGKFERRFEISTDHDINAVKTVLENDMLRIEMPARKKDRGGYMSRPINVSGIVAEPGKIAAKVLASSPHAMMIYCTHCGKHFDIIVAAEGAREYRCPHCGTVRKFDLEALISQAIDQTQKMARKNRGSR